MRQRAVGIAALGLVLALWGCSSGGAPLTVTREYTPNYLRDLGGDLARWTQPEVQVSLAPSSGGLRCAVEEAVRRWNAQEAGVALRLVESGGDIALAQAPTSDPDVQGNVLGVTIRRFTRSGGVGRMASASVKVRAGLTEDKRLAVVVHELGHALGLSGHSPSEADVMNAAPRPPGVPTQSDLNTVRTLYSGGSRAAIGPLHTDTLRCE